MKVLDLIETDEWANQSSNLFHLYQKQAAATHEFMVEVHKQLRIHQPRNNGISVELRLISRWTSLARRSSGQIAADLYIDHLDLPSLTKKYIKMYDAKQAYEQAGGSYEWPLPSKED